MDIIYQKIKRVQRAIFHKRKIVSVVLSTSPILERLIYFSHGSGTITISHHLLIINLNAKPLACINIAKHYRILFKPKKKF